MGIVDGCHIILYVRPGTDDAGDYYNRKDTYSYNVQGVVGPDKRIRHLHVGHAGSLHDTRVFRNSTFGMDPESLFAPHQYLLADSAYTPSQHLIPVFKKRSGKVDFEGDEGRFNGRVSRVRVRVEHAFGILKGRFSSLQGLRVAHKQQADQHRASTWVRACVMLHNLI